jgi:hypothetical protein
MNDYYCYQCKRTLNERQVHLRFVLCTVCFAAARIQVYGSREVGA